jgi:hypothetical protein
MAVMLILTFVVHSRNPDDNDDDNKSKTRQKLPHPLSQTLYSLAS